MTTAPHSEQADSRPNLTLVKDDAEAAIEGTVVKHQGEDTGRPAWLTAVYDHARDNKLYAPQIGRGYLNVVRRWFDSYHDGWPQQIATAKADFKAAKGDSAAEMQARNLIRQHRSDYRRHRLFHVGKSTGCAVTASVGTLVGAATGGILFDLGLALAALGLGAWNGRPNTAQALTAGSPSALPMEEGEAMNLNLTSGDAKIFDALKKLGFDGEIIQPLTRQPDGTSTTVIDLDDTVTALKSKTEALAGALKRDLAMIDVSKGAHANQARIWISDNDPFEQTRPSPLVQNPGPIDAWNDGVPVGWGKRGNTVRLLIRNQHTLIGGTTRSGKGVGMANLLAGAAMDPRINLRVVAGKENGEFDALARSGVAATYFKPNPARLLALTEALRADMDRRNRLLGDLSKSKMTEDIIMILGGIELVVIDEVATYTSPNSHDDRDQLLENLMQIAAVAAGAGILLVLTTQLPQVDVVPARLSMNCGTKWAMKVDSGTQSNTILGSGLAGSGGPDASKFDPPRPGLGWLNNPFAGGTDLARSFDLDEDERGEVAKLMQYAAKLRTDAGRLAGQWDDPIEQHLAAVTGLSSAAGGPKRNGQPGRSVHEMTEAQRDQIGALQGALMAMDHFGRDEAQLDEMASFIAHGVTADELGELLRKAGAGSTVKVSVPHKAGRVNGYRRADLKDALSFLTGA